MTLIEKFEVPAEEVADLGLSKIRMSNLGRIVALAGKNGAGKSRLLNKLESCIKVRNDGLEGIDNLKYTIANLEQAIDENLTLPPVVQLAQRLTEAKHQLALIDERVFCADASRKLGLLRFVPKRLDLVNPGKQFQGEVSERYEKAREPGLNNYEAYSLYYIHHLHAQWRDAGHADFNGRREEADATRADYERFQTMLEQLLGVRLVRNSQGQLTLFGRSLADAGLSEGQKVILQLCVALHAQGQHFKDTVFLLDEPENHLHPSAVIELLERLYQASDTSQIWIATHSVPLLAHVHSRNSMAVWFINDGHVSNAGRRPADVLGSLLGNDERIAQLNQFTGLPAQLALARYAGECLLPPGVVGDGERDPQVAQIREIIGKLRNGTPLKVLDFGAGKGRLLQGLAVSGDEKNNGPVQELLDYFAYDAYPDDKATCENVIGTYFNDGKRRYFNPKDELFNDDFKEGSIAVVVVCNALHEISPRQWPGMFGEKSLIGRALAENGYLLVVEDQCIPVGEKAHEFGFIVLDTDHLRTLFAVTDDDEDLTAQRFVCDARRDGRLKAHLIAKPLLSGVDEKTVRQAIAELQETARKKIEALRKIETPTYADGLSHGFWTQQYANTSLFLHESTEVGETRQ